MIFATLLKVHDKRSFYCSLCNAAFSCRSNCIAHIMQKHGLADREEANEKVRYEPGSDITKVVKQKSTTTPKQKSVILTPRNGITLLKKIEK